MFPKIFTQKLVRIFPSAATIDDADDDDEVHFDSASPHDWNSSMVLSCLVVKYPWISAHGNPINSPNYIPLKQ